MADVFISYAREDRPRAEQIARGLAAQGLECFWDTEIPPGQTWADYIEDKLTHCKALIVLWSEHSTKSQWVREEARLGRDKGVLIPAMIDAAQAPFGFGEVQAANLAAWNGDADDPDWRRFVAAVANAAGAKAKPAPPRPAAQMRPAAAMPASAAAAPGKAVPVWVWVTGAIVGTVVVLGIIGASMESQPPPVDKPTEEAGVPQPAPMPATAPAPAGENPQAIILAQLQQAQANFASQGFEVVGQPFSGSLAQGQTWNVPAQLFVGADYRVLGVCDRDCADLDLVLYDPNGAVASQDSSTDSHPVVAVAPSYNGNFTVQVQMYNCTVAPCYYAVALYGRRIQ
jgi:TIR domain